VGWGARVWLLCGPMTSVLCSYWREASMNIRSFMQILCRRCYALALDKQV